MIIFVCTPSSTDPGLDLYYSICTRATLVGSKDRSRWGGWRRRRRRRRRKVRPSVKSQARATATRPFYLNWNRFRLENRNPLEFFYEHDINILTISAHRHRDANRTLDAAAEPPLYVLAQYWSLIMFTWPAYSLLYCNIQSDSFRMLTFFLAVKCNNFFFYKINVFSNFFLM